MFRVIFILFLLALSPQVWACSCADPGDPAQNFSTAAAVFSARVTEEKKAAQGQYTEAFTLTVDKVWKGKVGKEFSVGLPLHGCAYWNFQHGKSYLIYAYSTPEGYSISHCSRTKLLVEGHIETRYLDAIAAGKETQSIDKTLPDLLQKDEHENIRVEAADLLGEKIRGAEARSAPDYIVNALVAATKDSSVSVRIAAAHSLSNLFLGKRENVQAALVLMLEDEDVRAVNAALSALGMAERGNSALFRPVVAALKRVRQMEWNDSNLFEGTLANFAVTLSNVAVTDVEKNEAAELMHGMLDDVKTPLTKVTVVQHFGFLGRAGGKHTQKLISILRGTDDPYLKQYTILALGNMQAVETQKIIEPYLGDKDCSVVKSVVEAVHKMNPSGFPVFFKEKGMPAMTQRFDECGSDFIWGLQSIGKDAKEMQGFLEAKYAAMEDGDWEKDQLKALLNAMKSQ